MKPVLVTGATGFIGWHVARKLIERGHAVRALTRPGSRVRELAVDAVEGCGSVFHVAADYRLWAKDPTELYRSNVDGTRNMLEAARSAGVERFVYTSTVGCVAMPPNRPGSEEMPVGPEEMTGAYKRSKFEAERVAMGFARGGFHVVIVNPTAPIGDHDVRPTPTGQIIVDFLKGNMPAYVDTGLNLVDVSDTAEGHLLAWERGRPGERYILGCSNLTLAQILGKLESITGRPAPRWRMPWVVALFVGMASSGWAEITGRPPRVPLDAVRMAHRRMFVTHEKASRELGFEPSPVDGALERAVKWFRENGYV